MNMLKITSALCFALLFSGNAYAAHPLITDDTCTQGKGRYQIEINSAFSSDKESVNGISAEESERTIAAVLSCGISDHIDVVVGLPRHSYTIKEEGITKASEHGIGDMTVELKWRFIDADANGFSLALKPGLSLPTGNEQKGTGNGAVSGGVALIATHQGAIGAVHCNLAYRRNAYTIEEHKEAARNDIWHASLAAEINLTENLRSVVDIGIETNEERAQHTHPSFLLGGLIYSVSENLDLDLGVKGGINDAETDTAVLAGVAARF